MKSFVPVAGVDVSKRFSDLCVLSPDNNVLLRQKIYHDMVSMKLAEKKLHEIELECGARPVVVMESTSHYHLILFQFFTDAGFEVVVVNPIQSGALKNINVRKVKNDRVDAYRIAMLYRLMYDIPTYYPHTAQKKYLLRRSYCHRGMFHSQEVIDYIEEKLRATWSPEQIACTPCELKMPSWRTIYRWIYEKYLVKGNLKVLSRKGKSHGVKETRGKYSKGKSIRKRDKSVYSRQEAGHWEADTVVSGQGKSKACFATLAERKTRFYIAVKLPDKKAGTMENAIVSALSAFPPQLVKTITCDRGTEFANWRRIEERLHCDVYFTDPYCAWQKGTNENLNGLLREFYPKGRNLSRVAPATLKRNLALINARPRKVLNFRSAQELWDFELNSCCT